MRPAMARADAPEGTRTCASYGGPASASRSGEGTSVKRTKDTIGYGVAMDGQRSGSESKREITILSPSEPAGENEDSRELDPRSEMHT